MKFLTYLVIGTIASTVIWFFVGGVFKENDKKERRAGCITCLILGLIGGLLFTIAGIV